MDIRAVKAVPPWVGTAVAVWRFPVKSMQGELLDAAEVTGHGLVGDRAYALVDATTGKLVSAKSTRHFAKLLDCRAVFVEPPRATGEVPPVRITLSDGTSVRSDAPGIDLVLSNFFGSDVVFAGQEPEDLAMDRSQPDLGEGSPLWSVPVGSFVDAFPVSVLTTSTLRRFSELNPRSRFDQRRFRMNIIVDTEPSGFIENEWIGAELSIGETVRLLVAMPDPRCVLTTMAQADLPNDVEVLRSVSQHNKIKLPGGSGPFPCAGVYTTVASPGTIRVDDVVVLTQ